MKIFRSPIFRLLLIASTISSNECSKKLVIDTDGGADGAAAILLALSAWTNKDSDYEVVAITCVHGNTFEKNVRSKTLDMAECIAIKNALFETQSETGMVVLVDWTKASWNIVNYHFIAESIVPLVAKKLSHEIRWIQRTFSIERTKIKLAGHSLGAHVMGLTGQKIYRDGLGKVGEITGVDPAGPLFDDYFQDGRLSKDDATNVVCIYSDYGILGTSVFNCTENLFPSSESNCTDKIDPLERHNCEPVKESLETWIVRYVIKKIVRGFVIVTTKENLEMFVIILVLIDIIFVFIQLLII